jgi:hypothetical protein
LAQIQFLNGTVEWLKATDEEILSAATGETT